MSELFDYDTNPKTFAGLLESTKAQVAAMNEPGYDWRVHGVRVHPAAIVELLEMVRYCAQCHA